MRAIIICEKRKEEREKGIQRKEGMGKEKQEGDSRQGEEDKQEGGERSSTVSPIHLRPLKEAGLQKTKTSATRLRVITDVLVGQNEKGGVEDERSQEGDGKVFRVTGYIYQKLLKKCLRAAKLLLWK